MPALNISLSDQEYENALRLCDAYGVPRSNDMLRALLKKIACDNLIPVPTPMGILEAWVNVPPRDNNEDTELGVALITNCGEIVDLACAKYNSKAKTVEAKFFGDISLEEPTKEYAFNAEDVETTFEEY